MPKTSQQMLIFTCSLASYSGHGSRGRTARCSVNSYPGHVSYITDSINIVSEILNIMEHFCMLNFQQFCKTGNLEHIYAFTVTIVTEVENKMTARGLI